MSEATAVTVPHKIPTEASKVQQVLIWILEGQSEHAIREGIEGNWPGSEADPLIIAATTKVNESGEIDHATVENWAFEATKFIYQKQLDIADYAGATRSIRQLREISATRTKQEPPTKKVEHCHQHEVGPVTQGSLDDRRERLAARIIGLREDP